MTRRFAFLLLSFFAVINISAQIRGNNIVVTVTPNHKDWTYKVGETAVFTVNVLKSGTLLDNATVDYEAGPVMYSDIKKSNIILADGTMTWKGTLKRPGFYRLKVTAHVDGRNYDGLCTAAFSPEKITPVTDCPADFDEFWTNTLNESRKNVPLNATKVLLPERCTDKVNVYQVSFQNIRWGSRTFGILCVPKAEGKYPAIYKVPGAGVRPYYGDVGEAAKGCIVLEIGIHGIPVTNTQDYYDLLANGALCNYWTFGDDNRDSFYYKRVFVGALRGIDYIASMPEWDGKNLGVMGSSQGGMLSIVCASLDSRVSCYAPVHAAMCDHTASLKGQPCGWPHYFYGVKNPDSSMIKCVGYYDGVNFAKRIKVPGWFSFGYNDEVVPPTSAFATYNVVTAPKELHPYPQTGHYWYQEQYDEWIGWMEIQLGIIK